jgi:hypothetical protein
LTRPAAVFSFAFVWRAPHPLAPAMQTMVEMLVVVVVVTMMMMMMMMP